MALVALAAPAFALNGGKSAVIRDCAGGAADPVGKELHNIESSAKPLPFYLHATAAEKFAKQRVLHRFYLNDMRTLPSGLPTVADLNAVLHRTRGKGPFREEDMAYLAIPDVYKNQTASTIPSPIYMLREVKASRGQEDGADVCNAADRRKVLIHAPGVNQLDRRIWSHPHTWSDVQALYATLENDYPHWQSTGGGTGARMFGRSSALKNSDIRYYQTLQNNNASANGPLASLNTSSMAEMVGNLVLAYTRGMSDVYVWTHSNGVVHTHKAWEIFVRMFDEPGAPHGLTWGQYWFGLRKANGYSDKMNVWYYHDQAATGVTSFMFFGDWHDRDFEYGEDKYGIIRTAGYRHRPFDILEQLGTRAFDNGKVQIRIDFIYNFADSMTAQAGGFVNPHETIGQKPSRFGMTAVNLAAQLNRQKNGKPVLWKHTTGSSIEQLMHADVDPSLGRFVAEDLYAYGTSSTVVENSSSSPPLKRRDMLPCGTPHQQVLAPWATTEMNPTMAKSVTRNGRSFGVAYQVYDSYPYADGWRNNQWQWSIELSPQIVATPENERGLRCVKAIHPNDKVASGLKLTYCDYNLCVYPYFPDPTGQTDSCKEDKECPPSLPFCNNGTCGIGTCGQYGKSHGWAMPFCDQSADHSWCEPNHTAGSVQTPDGCLCCSVTCDQLAQNHWGIKGYCEPPAIGMVPPAAACAGEKFTTNDCLTGCCQPTCQQLIGNHAANCSTACPGGSPSAADCGGGSTCCACGEKGQLCCGGSRCGPGATCDAATGMCK